MAGLAAAIRDEHGRARSASWTSAAGSASRTRPSDRPADPAAIAGILTGTVEAACRAAGLRGRA